MVWVRLGVLLAACGALSLATPRLARAADAGARADGGPRPCEDRSDCSGVTPVCDPDTHACRPCADDGGLSCPDRDLPVCQTSGPLAGACTQCSESDAHLCGGLRPRCVVEVGLCGCYGPAADRACGPPSSGLVCNGPAGICVAGCGPAPRNGCATGQTCLPSRGAIGICDPAYACADDSECPGFSMRFCVPFGDFAHCVQCRERADCGPGLVCDPTTFTCAECSWELPDTCRQEVSGARCLEDGRCGCSGDDDCGGPTSGRVCNNARARCVPGCRGGGGVGNGCPAPSVCSSTTSAIGRCVAADELPAGDPTDGGAPDAGPADPAVGTFNLGDHRPRPTRGSPGRPPAVARPSPTTARPRAESDDSAAPGCACAAGGVDDAAPTPRGAAVGLALAALACCGRRRRGGHVTGRGERRRWYDPEPT